MKANQAEKTFIPVTLTLESQHEVDAIFALLNHIGLAEAVGISSAYAVLSPYKSPAYVDLHIKIQNFMKP